jgi:hypothetical protein
MPTTTSKTKHLEKYDTKTTVKHARYGTHISCIMYGIESIAEKMIFRLPAAYFIIRFFFFLPLFIPAMPPSIEEIYLIS